MIPTNLDQLDIHLGQPARPDFSPSKRSLNSAAWLAFYAKTNKQTKSNNRSFKLRASTICQNWPARMANKQMHILALLNLQYSCF